MRILAFLNLAILCLARCNLHNEFRKLIRVAEDQGWWLFFQHDADLIMGRLGMGDAGLALGDVVRADEPDFEGV